MDKQTLQLMRPVARAMRAMLVCRGDWMAMEPYVDNKGWRDTPEVGYLAKTAVTALSTNDGPIQSWMPLFIKLNEALMPLTVFGRLQPFMRRVPFRTSVVYSSDTSEAQFVSENIGSSPMSTIPVTKLELATGGTSVDKQMMNPATLAMIVVLTADLVKMGPIGSDDFISREILRILQKGLDRGFIDPSRNEAAFGSPPGSITSTGTILDSSGSTLSAVDDDLHDMVAALVSNEMPLLSAHWIMHPITACSLAKLRGTGGAPAFPKINARGGELLGLPVLTTTTCTAEGSPGEYFISLIEAEQVTYADDGAGQMDYSTNAALEMSTTPSGGAQPLLSLWQNDLMAARVTRYLNWQARPGAAATLRNVAY